LSIEALPPTAVPELHTSHRRLLNREARPRGQARVDAVIVPASRPAENLMPAVLLTAEIGCPLIALCSRRADIAKIRTATIGTDVEVVAVELRPTASCLPPQGTTALLADTPFKRDADTALKRNIGLALTHMTRWERVLFLDDDIAGVQAEAVRRGASLLGEYDIVGLHNVGFPDNSVVCHANRDTGGEQDTFIGGGAMLFGRKSVTSMFPDVFNEDWLFLLDGHELARCAVYGAFAQARFDPYRTPARAVSEEFGDCLAEGLFALLDQGRSLDAANRPYWRGFLADRRRFIEMVLERLPTASMSDFRRDQVGAALQAARSSLKKIDPDLCVRFLAAWRQDRYDWRDFVRELPTGLSVSEALAHLGVKC